MVDQDVPTICEDCGREQPAGDLTGIEDPDDRLSAGEFIPAGQCRHCGACCYIDEESVT